eukprot:3264219-Rhodomonas_salina.1
MVLRRLSWYSCSSGCFQSTSASSSLLPPPPPPPSSRAPDAHVTPPRDDNTRRIQLQLPASAVQSVRKRGFIAFDFGVSRVSCPPSPPPPTPPALRNQVLKTAVLVQTVWGMRAIAFEFASLFVLSKSVVEIQRTAKSGRTKHIFSR